MLALLASAVAAEDDATSEVKRLASEGKKPEAVRLAGDWLAQAQKRDDVVAEESAWRALRDIALSGDEYRGACAEVMKLLDPKRNGAYVSAHLLALELVRISIRRGDDLHLAEAATILATPRKDGGACAPVLKDLAAGVVAARRGEAADARLRAAFDVALKNGWLNLATYAGTELACAERKAGRESDALERLDGALRESGDRALLQLRRALAEDRIPERTIELGSGSVSAKGGKGGRGGSATQSPVGAAWGTLRNGKAVLTVKRGARDFEIEPRFPGAPKGKQAPGPGVQHWDGGGITLSFYDHGVALAMVDLTGRRGQPGDSSEPQSWPSYYPLAPGETWSLTREGTVSVRK